MNKPETPFVPGARVALFTRPDDADPAERFVEKVYKNGNFVLAGDTTRQQWKPFKTPYAVGEWRAAEVRKRGFSRRTLAHWSDVVDQDITARREKARRLERIRDVHLVVTDIYDRARKGEPVDTRTLAALEQALAARASRASARGTRRGK